MWPNSLSDDVSVIDLTTFAEVTRIPVTTSPLSPQLHRGKLLFTSSRSTRVSRDRWMSCESCHFDGEQDGRTWLFPDGPRNTTNLRGLAHTHPLHWSADRDEVQDFEFTIRELQAGTGLLEDPHPELGPPNTGRSADLDALAAFVESLHPKPSPFRQDGRGAYPGGSNGGKPSFSGPMWAVQTAISPRFLRICACMISGQAMGRVNSWDRGLIRRRCGGSGIRRRICMMDELPLSETWWSPITPRTVTVRPHTYRRRSCTTW